MINWRDTSSYSQGKVRGEPSIWEAVIIDFVVKVHRHIDYPGTWLLTCHSMSLGKHDLGTYVLEIAKKKAVDHLIHKLGRYVALRDKLIFERGTDL